MAELNTEQAHFFPPSSSFLLSSRLVSVRAISKFHPQSSLVAQLFSIGRHCPTAENNALGNITVVDKLTKQSDSEPES